MTKVILKEWISYSGFSRPSKAHYTEFQTKKAAREYIRKERLFRLKNGLTAGNNAVGMCHHYEIYRKENDKDKNEL